MSACGITGDAQSAHRWPEEELKGGRNGAVGWICTEATDLVVDWFLGMKEREKSRESKEASPSCRGRTVVAGSPGK